MNRFVVGAAIETVMQARLALDPKQQVPVYDVHLLSGQRSGYCIVSSEFLDELWHRVNPGLSLPHEHLDPSTEIARG